MDEHIERIRNLKAKIDQTWVFLKLDEKQKDIRELEAKTLKPDFWQDRGSARTVTQTLADLQTEYKAWETLRVETEELLAFADLARRESDASVQGEIEKKMKSLEEEFGGLEFHVLLSGAHDRKNVIMALHAGTGGVDAMDWTGMLLRMYLRYCEKKGWRVSVLDESRGQEAGYKSVLLRVEGSYAYGYLKSEAGVHRLVRISPFDAEKMRHTSFALVEVLPELEEIEEMKIDPKDLRVDTFLSSGHGGQSVQTTYSAVRIVHLPTGITVSCQNERSQLQNKEMAMRILASKLKALEEAKLEEEKQLLRGEYTEAAWGNQARSYVLQPYKMVKDHRTEYETQEVEKVLDGFLDEAIESYLKIKPDYGVKNPKSKVQKSK
ncbi:MAG: peptide chain release factor 2 [Patescibacteria group bacterium]